MLDNLTITIPKGWELKKIRDLVLIKKGEQLNRLDMLESGKYPALNGGIYPSGYTDKWNTEAFTITISEGGNSCGYVNFNKEKFWCGGHCYSLLDLKDNIDKNFLYQVLKFKQSLIMKLRVGSGLPNIQKRSLEDFCLLIPNMIDEQKKIAEILSKVDDDINRTEEVIKKTEKLKRGLMQVLFTKGIGHKKFKNTELGEIPEEWKTTTIKDSGIKLIDGDRGVNYPKLKDFSKEGYCLFLNNKNIKYDRFVFNECNFIAKEKDEAMRKGKLERNDIILTSRGTVGNVAYYDSSVFYDHVRINSGMLIFRHGENYDPLFLYKFMSGPFMKKRYKEMGSGSAQPQLPIGSLELIQIPLLPIKEQKQIAEIILSIDKKIEVNKQIKNKLIKLKKGLANDLLNGVVRVN